MLAVCSALPSVPLNLSPSPSSLSLSKTKAGGASQVFLVRGLLTFFFFFLFVDIFIVLHVCTSEEGGELLAKTGNSFSQFASLLSGSSRQDLGKHSFSLHAGLTRRRAADASGPRSRFGAYACKRGLASLVGHDRCGFCSNSCCWRRVDLGHGGGCSSCWTGLPGLSHGSTGRSHLPRFGLSLAHTHAHAHTHALSLSWGLLLRSGGCSGTGLSWPGSRRLGLLLKLRPLSWSPVYLRTRTALPSRSWWPAGGALTPGRAAAGPGGAWLALHVDWPLGFAA